MMKRNSKLIIGTILVIAIISFSTMVFADNTTPVIIGGNSATTQNTTTDNTQTSNTTNTSITPQISNENKPKTEELISSFSTKIYTKDSARQNNISITSSALNETTVANGSTFSGTVTVPADIDVIIENANFANPVVVA